MAEEQQPPRSAMKPREINTLDSIDGVRVFGKMANGEPVFIPLKLLFSALERDFVAKIRLGGGQPYGRN